MWTVVPHQLTRVNPFGRARHHHRWWQPTAAAGLCCGRCSRGRSLPIPAQGSGETAHRGRWATPKRLCACPIRQHRSSHTAADDLTFQLRRWVTYACRSQRVWQRSSANAISFARLSEVLDPKGHSDPHWRYVAPALRHSREASGCATVTDVKPSP